MAGEQNPLDISVTISAENVINAARCIMSVCRPRRDALTAARRGIRVVFCDRRSPVGGPKTSSELPPASPPPLPQRRGVSRGSAAGDLSTALCGDVS